MRNILVISPHPDDETLGCGGTLLKHKAQKNDNLFWMIVTKFKKKNPYFKTRSEEITRVSKRYKFKKTFQLDFIAAELDKYSKNEIIKQFTKCIKLTKPEIIYIPYEFDSHSDHRIVYECINPFIKSFRYNFIKQVRVYETISETNFDNSFVNQSFKPNLWIDISEYFKEKIEIMKIYKTEIKKHPFPRSVVSIRSLAKLRGSFANSNYAEAFMLIKYIID